MGGAVGAARTCLRLALREIRNHRRFSVFFALNLALGLAGFVALDAFEASVARELRARSKGFLGGDLAVRARRALEAEEIRRLDAAAGPGAEVSSSVELFSMAGGAGRARLVEIRAVDGRFPLYGAVVLEGAGAAGPEQRAALVRERGAWVDPALLAQLGTRLGEQIRIGAGAFRLLDTVARDGGRATSGFSIAPRIYVALEHLEATQLVTTGSRISHIRLYRLPEGRDAAAVGARMRRALDDPQLRVRTHDEATRDLARAYDAVGSYLGLVATIAVFLAGLGAAYLFRAFLARRLREVAILLSLGATRGGAQAVFLVQLWLLALVAAALACGLGALLLPGLARVAAEFVPEGTSLRVGAQSAAAVFAIAIAGSAAACLPLLVRIRALRPAELFREYAQPRLERGPRDLLLLLPALVLFWALAVWRVGDLEAGSLFAGIFGGALAALAGVAHLLLRGLARLPARASVPLAPRLALRQLARARGSSVAGFVAIASCALLLSLSPQLRAVLERDLDPPGGSQLPSLFLFDIQPDQLAPLQGHVAARGPRLQRVSPLVRARLEAINGASVREGAASDGRSLSEDRAARLRTRRYNLTYAPALNESERLVAGVPFARRGAGGSGAPAQLSLEVGFAESLGVALGDRLAFDVQGVAVEGRVANLREVRWNSLQPNFFVTFEPGVLEEAPHIYLASVPSLPAAEREALQASIVEAFPNVSVIDVTRAVRRMLGLLAQLQWALTSTASLSLAVGLLLVFAIARDQARARRWETNLLKVLGAEFPQIRGAVDIEFGLLGLLATLAGGACSLLASAILTHTLLDTRWEAAWSPLLLATVAIPAICIATARAATRGVLRERPLALLQEGAAPS